jgi:uncharacterized protein (TIGR00730 family)
MDKKTAAICVFCGSSHGARPAYAEAASRLGTLIGTRGYQMVFGGGNVGLMGDTARAAYAAGAKVTGVLPVFLEHIERPLEGVDEIIVPDLQQRKNLMLDKSDAFVVLPGGVGTYDEIFEVLSTRQLKVHDKPIVLIDTDGYFEPLVPLLARLVREGFAQRLIETFYVIVKTPEEAMDRIDALLAPRFRRS